MAYVVLDWRALAREGATEEGPQEGIQDGRHSIDRDGSRENSSDADHGSPQGEPAKPGVVGTKGELSSVAKWCLLGSDTAEEWAGS